MSDTTDAVEPQHRAPVRWGEGTARREVTLYRDSATGVRWTDAAGVTWRVVGVPLTKREALRRLLTGKPLFVRIELPPRALHDA